MGNLEKRSHFNFNIPPIKEALTKSFDRLRTNGNILITFVVRLSNHECNQPNPRLINKTRFQCGYPIQGRD